MRCTDKASSRPRPITRLTTHPLYAQVRVRLTEGLADGTFKPGQKLPPETEIARSFGVSRMTVREALRQLEEQGAIIRYQGRGTFVVPSATTTTIGFEELRGISQLFRERGVIVGTSFCKVVPDVCSEELSRHCPIGRDERIIRVERLRTADSVPVVYTVDVFKPELVGDSVPSPDEVAASLFGFLERRYRVDVDYGTSIIIPISAGEAEADLFQIERGAPLLLIEQNYYDPMDRFVMYSKNYLAGDRARIMIRRHRVHARRGKWGAEPS